MKTRKEGGKKGGKEGRKEGSEIFVEFCRSEKLSWHNVNSLFRRRLCVNSLNREILRSDF